MAAKKLKKTAKKKSTVKKTPVKGQPKAGAVSVELLKSAIELMDITADLCERDGDFTTSAVLDGAAVKLADRLRQLQA